MAFYKKRRAVKDDHEAGELHMFFSPTRVPVGLTNKEVAICIKLRRFRQIENKLLDTLRGQLAPLMFPIMLPRELMPLPPGKKMTRKLFAAGIKKYKQQVLDYIDHFKKVIAEQLDQATA